MYFSVSENVSPDRKLLIKQFFNNLFQLLTFFIEIKENFPQNSVPLYLKKNSKK